MTINTLKIRDDRMPLQFAADGDKFELQAGSEASWLSSEAFGHKELRSRIKAVVRSVDWQAIADDWQQVNGPVVEEDLENNDE
ncbi:hypothetical protein LJR029_004954 [Caballeronia sp. LjRoot29]|uniref:hypothetical protein n=1 Tax=Caballeronia sp. LjRoot29 TaxID=3342315 RepID=UPI003ECE2C6C